MPQISSFFELAALLIPVLMLSGYATQRMGQPLPLFQSVLQGTAMRDMVIQLAIIVVFGALPVLAEVIALSATMNGGEASRGETCVVAGALAIGMWSLAGAIVWPWLKIGRNSSRSLKLVHGIGALFLLVVTFGALLRGVDAQSARSTTARVIAEYDASSARSSSSLALSEISEALLREQLVGASATRRVAIRRDIVENLVNRATTLIKDWGATATRARTELQGVLERTP
jgi:hypothetical protein